MGGPLLIPLAIAAGAGIAGTAVGSWLSGGTKKDGAVYHAPYETYSPQLVDARQLQVQYPSYQVQIDSPFAVQSSKKEMAAKQDVSPAQSVSPVGGSMGTDIPFLPIAAIVAVAFVGSAYLGRKK